jgi:phage baseplate assembly protein W
MPTIFTRGLSTNSRRWSDLDLDFQAHPVTKDIVVKTDVEAVKRSVRNLILTNRYERPFQPQIDGGVTRQLFELATPVTETIISNIIRNTLSNFEPRAEVIAVDVESDIDRNGFNVTIFFRAINTPDPVTVEIFLERLR